MEREADGGDAEPESQEAGRTALEDPGSRVTSSFFPAISGNITKTMLRRAVIFMENILKDPTKLFDWTRLYTVSVAGSLMWGHRATSLESFWYKEFYQLMDLVLLSLEFLLATFKRLTYC